MFVLYNLLQLLLLPLLFAPLAVIALSRQKYRNRLPARLGWVLRRSIPPGRGKTKTFWLHALSVGEITSAVPLVAGLRRAYPEGRIIISVTTSSGRQVADQLLSSLADHIIDGPLDLLPVVRKFIATLRPDLFILVETDFWPNTLNQLRLSGIPTVLVNGRISAASLARYRRFAIFFRPMMQSFSCLCMQTENGRRDMVALGVDPRRVHSPGNLKYASRADLSQREKLKQLLPPARLLLLAGSTHPGEEEMLLRSYQTLRKELPEIFLLIAPRDPGRTGEICRLAENLGLHASRRTTCRPGETDLLIIDSIGELLSFYALADIAFVGGSLVDCGGHNPLEPAALGVPVLFGPHMEDFQEVAEELIVAGGALKISNEQQLLNLLKELASSSETRTRQGEAARHCVQRRTGVVDRHLLLIENLLCDH
jgi:3-deoxy-D-manno-octulosonic-acid transferase